MTTIPMLMAHVRCQETLDAELTAEDNAATLKRKREVLIKKAQEQSKQLDAQIVSTRHIFSSRRSNQHTLPGCLPRKTPMDDL